MVPWTRQAGRKASGRELSDGFQNIHRGGRRSPSFCYVLAESARLPFPKVPSPPSPAPRPHAAANTKARVAKPKDVPCSSSEKMLWTQRRTQDGERGQEAEKRGSRGSIRAGGGGQTVHQPFKRPTLPPLHTSSTVSGKKKKKRERERQSFLASWPLPATILPSTGGQGARACTCKR